VSAFEEALAHNLPIGLSSGGKIEEMCRANNIPHIKLPLPSPHFQPRIGTGYFFSTLFQVLVNQGLVPDMTAELLQEAEDLKTALPAIEEEGKALSKKLIGKTPVIYASPKYKSVAMVWKIKLNENAKTPAFWNFFPELNHNEMVGFTLPQAKFVIIMLRDREDHPKNQKRFEVTAALLRQKGVDVEILDMSGKSVYVRYSRYSLKLHFVLPGLEYGQDPTPVDMVEELKRLLV
jgi:glucose/mannose-6-phosphate isomerase